MPDQPPPCAECEALDGREITIDSEDYFKLMPPPLPHFPQRCIWEPIMLPDQPDDVARAIREGEPTAAERAHAILDDAEERDVVVAADSERLIAKATAEIRAAELAAARKMQQACAAKLELWPYPATPQQAIDYRMRQLDALRSLSPEDVLRGGA